MAKGVRGCFDSSSLIFRSEVCKGGSAENPPVIENSYTLLDKIFRKSPWSPIGSLYLAHVWFRSNPPWPCLLLINFNTSYIHSRKRCRRGSLCAWHLCLHCQRNMLNHRNHYRQSHTSKPSTFSCLRAQCLCSPHSWSTRWSTSWWPMKCTPLSDPCLLTRPPLPIRRTRRRRPQEQHNRTLQQCLSILLLRYLTLTLTASINDVPFFTIMMKLQSMSKHACCYSMAHSIWINSN